MTLKDLTCELQQLREQAKTILDRTQFREYDDLSGVEHNRTDGETLFLVREYKGVLSGLSEMEYSLNYLARPVKFTDTLILDELGRYCTKDKHITYTCGNGIEFEYQEKVYSSEKGIWENIATWRTSRIEHNGERYYIVGYPAVEIDGLRVRVR